MNRTTVVELRVTDLRAEFEAQLRAVAHIEEHLRKTKGKSSTVGADLARVRRHQLAGMLSNNPNIRTVLNELASEAAAVGA